MFPTELELKLHFDELRHAAEQHTLAQSLRETPTLWERLTARLRLNGGLSARTLSAARVHSEQDLEAFNQAVCKASALQ